MQLSNWHFKTISFIHILSNCFHVSHSIRQSHLLLAAGKCVSKVNTDYWVNDVFLRAKESEGHLLLWSPVPGSSALSVSDMIHSGHLKKHSATSRCMVVPGPWAYRSRRYGCWKLYATRRVNSSCAADFQDSEGVLKHRKNNKFGGTTFISNRPQQFQESSKFHGRHSGLPIFYGHLTVLMIDLAQGRFCLLSYPGSVVGKTRSWVHCIHDPDRPRNNFSEHIKERVLYNCPTLQIPQSKQGLNICICQKQGHHLDFHWSSDDAT